MAPAKPPKQTLPFPCPDPACIRGYTHQGRLLHHVKAHHPAHLPALDATLPKHTHPIHCPVLGCPTFYKDHSRSRAALLTQHMRFKHASPSAPRSAAAASPEPEEQEEEEKKPQKAFPCPHADCGRSFDTLHEREMHDIDWHRPVAPRSRSPLQELRCGWPGCGEVFLGGEALFRHEQVEMHHAIYRRKGEGW